MRNNKKIGLAFSGGGYRAAAFHLGTLKKLNQLGLLDQVDVISTISGGSIIGAYLALEYRGDFSEFEAKMRGALRRSTMGLILWNPRFIGTAIAFLGLPVMIGIWTKLFLAAALCVLLEIILFVAFQFYVMPLTAYTISAYDRIFFGKKTLKDMGSSPYLLAINASNLETGRLFTFSHNRMNDSTYQFDPYDTKFIHEDFPISHAVASSTAVPFVFNPVKLAGKFFGEPHGKRVPNPSLVDGGLYDNQGIHKLTQGNSRYFCEVVICSDGSMPFNDSFNGTNSFLVLYRSTDIMMRKIKNLQFIRDVYKGKDEIAYFSLDWEYERIFDELVDSVRDEKLKRELIDYYAIPIAWIGSRATVEANRANIKNHLKTLVNYESVVAQGLGSAEIKEACRISTALGALTDREMDILSKHAGCLAELHVKLFCPTLVR